MLFFAAKQYVGHAAEGTRSYLPENVSEVGLARLEHLRRKMIRKAVTNTVI